MESGSIEYDTPGGKLLFRLEAGGIVNSNVLHVTSNIAGKRIYSYFIFSDVPTCRGTGSRIETNMCAYHSNRLSNSAFSGNAEEKKDFETLAASFRLSSDEFGYEK